MFTLGGSEWRIDNNPWYAINVFLFWIRSATFIFVGIFFPISFGFVHCFQGTVACLTPVGHAVISPRLSLLCGVQWDLHLHPLCAVDRVSPHSFSLFKHISLFSLSIYEDLPMFSSAQVPLLKSSSWVLVGAIQCTKNSLWFIFHGSFPPTSFGFFLNTMFCVGMMSW